MSCEKNLREKLKERLCAIMAFSLLHLYCYPPNPSNMGTIEVSSPHQAESRLTKEELTKIKQTDNLEGMLNQEDTKTGTGVYATNQPTNTVY